MQACRRCGHSWVPKWACFGSCHEETGGLPPREATLNALSLCHLKNQAPRYCLKLASCHCSLSRCSMARYGGDVLCPVETSGVGEDEHREGSRLSRRWRGCRAQHRARFTLGSSSRTMATVGSDPEAVWSACPQLKEARTSTRFHSFKSFTNWSSGNVLRPSCKSSWLFDSVMAN
jgi:hypothetical protein